MKRTFLPFDKVHKWEKVHETIDIHGQIVYVYRCKRCGARGKQCSPNLARRKARILIMSKDKECVTLKRTK